MQKMWKQLGSESRGFERPEVTKGFSQAVQVAVGGGGPLMVMVGSEEKEDNPLTGSPFQGRRASYTTQTAREKGMQSGRNGDRASRRRAGRIRVC